MWFSLARILLSIFCGANLLFPPLYPSLPPQPLPTPPPPLGFLGDLPQPQNPRKLVPVIIESQVRQGMCGALMEELLALLSRSYFMGDLSHITNQDYRGLGGFEK